MLLAGAGLAFAPDYCNGSHVGNVAVGANVPATDLTVNNVHGSLGHYTFLKAYLADDHGKALPNKSVIFKVDGDPRDYVAVTSTNGHALLFYLVSQKPGTYSIKAEFKGDEKLSPTTATGVLTVI
jgi:hypothetical protein